MSTCSAFDTTNPHVCPGDSKFFMYTYTDFRDRVCADDYAAEFEPTLDLASSDLTNFTSLSNFMVGEGPLTRIQ
jgi:hypothetical protein